MTANRLLHLSIALLLASSLFSAGAAEPLRVFIRGGGKTHGPNQHDHPRFLGDWTKLLGERGLKVDGAMEFPTAEQLARTDVVLIYAADGMKMRARVLAIPPVCCDPVVLTVGNGVTVSLVDFTCHSNQSTAQ